MRANFIHIQHLLVRALAGSSGDVAEFGVWRCTTLMPILEVCRLEGRTVHAVDAFEGMAKETARDGHQFKKGALRVPYGLDNFQELTRPYKNIVPHIGWVPDVLNQMQDVTFGFVHLDLDQYAPTLAALEFLWPRLAWGGIIACHDWFPDSEYLAAGAIRDFTKANDITIDGEQPYSHHCWLRK